MKISKKNLISDESLAVTMKYGITTETFILYK